jgi:hypothetical protein
MKQLAIGGLMAVLLSANSLAHALCPSVPTAQRFTLNGDEVTDKRTRLVWQRCSVGQSWSQELGTCTGNASVFKRKEAEALVNAIHASSAIKGNSNATATVKGWRLPNAMELEGLADKGCQGPAIDLKAFPATPSQWFWTSMPHEGDPDDAWGIHFYNAYSSHYLRYSDVYVRLVRVFQ